MTHVPVRTYLISLLALVALECLSFVGYRTPVIGQLVFFVLIVMAAVSVWKRPELGILILVAELCVGGKGYLVSLAVGSATISLRLMLFCVILGIWVLRYRPRTQSFAVLPKSLRLWLMAIALMTAWGVVIGLLRGNGWTAVFFDANAFLFFLLILVFVNPKIDWTRTAGGILAVIAAAATVLGIKSLLSLGLFAHLDPSQLLSYYRWIRTTGVGEIAYINGNAYRVFFQSQVWGLFAAVILSAGFFPIVPRSRQWWLLAPIMLGVTAVIISLSRSFWIGAGSAIIAAAWIGIRQFHWNVKRLLMAGAVTLGIVAGGYVLMSWALNFPYPFPPARDSQAARLLGQRFVAIGGEAAASSRINQLTPLRDGIFRHPLLGSGFGTALTYSSNDPRQLQSASGGRYTTYAFEWGYLDLLLKVGLLGLTAYLGLIGAILKRLWYERNPRSASLLVAVVGLCVIHITTPYLNHPLGIGLLILSMSSLADPDQASI